MKKKAEQKGKEKEKEKKPDIKTVFSDNMFLLRIALKEAPLSTIQALLWGMKHEVIVFIEHIYMIAYIIDSIQYQKPFINVFIFVVSVFVSVSIISVFGDYINHRTRPKANEKINRRIRMELYEKAAEIDLECYDNPEFYNDFIWAMNNATERVNSVIDSVAGLLGAISAIILTGIYIFTQDKFGLIIALFSFFIVTFFRTAYRKLSYEQRNMLNPLFRKRDYINRVFYLNDYAKEIRLSNVKEKLLKDFDESERNILKVYDKTTKKLALLNFISGFVCNYFIFNFLYILYLMYITVVKKLIGYGTMVGLYNTCGRLRRNISVFTEIIPQFTEHSLYISKIRKFLSYEVKIKANPDSVNPPDEVRDIEFKNVSFSYGSGSDYVLKNISLKINAGEKIAIVGYNGAGKTTFVKMLMHLYDVTDGEILYGGLNIKDYKTDSFRNMFSTLFQDYQIFSSSVRENISMDISEPDYEKLEKSVKQSGFAERLKSLLKGFDTELTREFDDEGTDLSGGEKQKVAISRCLYKGSRIIILDEPSSALDPIAEYELNSTMLNLERDKTIIFISHRLSTTKMADRIYMFDSGEIIEEGTHDELMSVNGKYAEMFNLQAEKYRYIYN